VLPWKRVRVALPRLIAWLFSLAAFSRNARVTSSWLSANSAALALRTWQWMSRVNHLPRGCAGPGKRPGIRVPGGEQVNSIGDLRDDWRDDTAFLTRGRAPLLSAFPAKAGIHRPTA